MQIFLIILLATNIITLLYLALTFKPKESVNNNYQEQYVLKQLESILDTMEQAILLFNHKSKLLFYNKYASKILNLTDDDLKKHAISIFENKEIRDAIVNRNTTEAFDIYDLDHIFTVNIYTVKETTRRKDKVSVIVVLKDVTETRTIEKTKKDFFSHASHELKSPLTAIVGYSELVNLKMINSDEYEEIFERIHKQANHMTLLVDEMSTLSRLELAPRNENMEYIDLESVLNKVLESLEPFKKERNVEFVVESKPISFYADELDINKLFKNLIENAIKYSPKNSVVHIDLFTENNEITFLVKDHGIGILPKHQKRIFERFYRIDKGRLVAGTGLGLAIVKHILIKYRGEIKIDSVINEGSTITVKFNKSN